MNHREHYSPNAAGEALAKFCTDARRTLRARLTRPVDDDEAAWDVYIRALVSIRRMDHNELRSALAEQIADLRGDKPPVQPVIRLDIVGAPCSLDDAEHSTILAALRFYQQSGQGDPMNRSDAIHDLATNGGELASSLCADDIDQLCEKINVKGWRVEVNNLTPDQKAAAVEYVAEKYCARSDDDIECLAELDDRDFSRGEKGVWVRTWCWAPESAMPNFYADQDQGGEHDETR